MRGLRPGLGKAAQAAPTPTSVLSPSQPTDPHPPVSLRRGAIFLPGHLQPPGLQGLGPVRQEPGDSCKNKNSPAHRCVGVCRSLWPTDSPRRDPSWAGPRQAGQVPPSTGRPRAQWSRGVIWGGAGYLVPVQLPTHSVSCSRG